MSFPDSYLLNVMPSRMQSSRWNPSDHDNGQPKRLRWISNSASPWETYRAGMIGVDIANSDQHTNPVVHVTYHVKPYDDPKMTGGKDYTSDLRRFQLAFIPVVSSREPLGEAGSMNPSHLAPHEYQSEMDSLTGAGRTRVTLLNIVQLNYLLHKWSLQGVIDPETGAELRPESGYPLNKKLTPEWVKRNFKYVGEIFTEDTEKSSVSGERAMVVVAQADQDVPNIFGEKVFGRCHLWLLIRKVKINTTQFYLPYSGRDGPFGEYLGNVDTAGNVITHVTRIVGAWTTKNHLDYKVPEFIKSQYGDDCGYGSVLYQCVDDNNQCVDERSEAIYVGMVTKNLNSEMPLPKDRVVDIDVYDSLRPHLEVYLYTM